MNEVLGAVDGRFSDYEILVFDDASSDSTGVVADELAARNKNIKVIHNRTTTGLGCNYKKGIELAQKDYIILIPGDNEVLGSSVAEMFDLINKADIIIPYIENYSVRPLSRQIASKCFTLLMNFLFRLDLNYYNGTVIHKRKIIQSEPVSTNGFAYQAEILTRLIKSGCSFVETGMKIRGRAYGISKAFSLCNILSVLRTIVRLMLEIYLGGGRYSKETNRVQVTEHPQVRG